MVDYKITPTLDPEFGLLLDVFPPAIFQALAALPRLDALVEVVLDLGRKPEARFPDDFVFFSETVVSSEDLAHVAKAISNFGCDNRAGIESTLHRVSAIRNRAGKIVGVTCRVGRAITGTIDLILDVVRSGKSICLLGPPGVGKTTILRECARVLAEDRKRVVIVDTSNEIGGDGDIPHAGIGFARRMQVANSANQHLVMIEAVENHMPEVIVVDEIGSEVEALAARTIAERGVQLIATAHGKTLENLLMNPTLSDLVGGIESVTLSDEEARRRETRKTVLERKAPPTFDVLIEINGRDRFAIYKDVSESVDLLLRGIEPQPELRQASPSRQATDEEYPISSPSVKNKTTERSASPVLHAVKERNFVDSMKSGLYDESTQDASISVFPYGISHNKLRSALEKCGISATIATSWKECDLLLLASSIERKSQNTVRLARADNIQVVSVKSNSFEDLEKSLRDGYSRMQRKPNGNRSGTSRRTLHLSQAS